MAVAWVDAGNRVMVWDELGSWRLWKRFAWSAGGKACVDLGSIGRVRATDVTLVVDDFSVRREPSPT